MIPKQFSEKLRFTLSKIKKSALLWNAAKARNTKASGTTWPVKRSLQRSLSGCSPSWQWPLLPSSFLLNLWWESRQEVPILARHPATAESPGSDAWQGAGCFCRWCWARRASAWLSEVFWWPCHSTRAVAFSRWRDHNPWLQPSREIVPRVIVRDPNHFGAEIRVLPGLALMQ